MPTFVPETLATWTAGRWTARPDAPLTGFSFDTRTLRAGDVFVALQTEKRDGHDFLRDAQAAGATAAIVSREVAGSPLPQLVVADSLTAFQAVAREHRRTFRGPVVGISGSAGKTSTKDLLAVLLGGAASGVVATEGNLNNHLGVPLTLTRIDPARTTAAVIEAGVSAPGEMELLAAMIAPDVSIITLVAPAHTEALGGVEGVAREKARLPAATRPGGVALFTRPTAEFAAFRDLPGPTLVLERAGTAHSAPGAGQRVPFSVSHHGDETRLALAYGAPPSLEFRFRRVSDGMAENAALALTAALRLGVSREVLQARLVEWKPARMRGEVRRIDGRLLYLDCYNANPASMADALAAFVALVPAGEPRMFVMGCMEELGEGAPAYHRALGRSLPIGPGDRLFVIGTQAHEVCAGVLEQGDFSEQIQMVSTLAPVVTALAAWRGAVFVKGSRRYQLERILEGGASHSLPC